MDSTTENLKNVINVWRTANRVEVSNDLHAKHISDLVASVFSPGKNYYFILSFYI